MKKVKADLELYKKYWIDYFKKRETKNVKKRETTTILTADREGRTSIRDSFFCYISSRFLFSIFLLTEFLALKTFAFLGLISRALSKHSKASSYLPNPPRAHPFSPMHISFSSFFELSYPSTQGLFLGIWSWLSPFIDPAGFILDAFYFGGFLLIFSFASFSRSLWIFSLIALSTKGRISPCIRRF